MKNFLLKIDKYSARINNCLSNLSLKEMEENQYYIEINRNNDHIDITHTYRSSISFGYFNKEKNLSWLFPSSVVVKKQELKDKYFRIRVFTPYGIMIFYLLENGKYFPAEFTKNNFKITVSVVWQNEDETFLVKFFLTGNDTIEEVEITDTESDFYKINMCNSLDLHSVANFIQTENSEFSKESVELINLISSYFSKWVNKYDELNNILENLADGSPSEKLILTERKFKECLEQLQSEHNEVATKIEELEEKHFKLMMSIGKYIESLSEHFSLNSEESELKQRNQQLEAEVKQLNKNLVIANSELRTLKKTSMSAGTTTVSEDELNVLKTEVSKKTAAVTNLEQELLKKKKSNSVGIIVLTAVITFLVSSLIFGVYICLLNKNTSPGAEAINVAEIRRP